MKSIRYSTVLSVVLIVVLAPVSHAFSTMPAWDEDDKEEIQRVFTKLSDAWEQADAVAWGNCFTENADFTTWFGLHLKGRKAIAEGHQWVFNAVYPGTRYEFEIRDLRLLKPDVAVVHLNASIIDPGGTLPEAPHTFPVAVLQKREAVWQIVMFHNMENRLQEMEELRAAGDMGDVRN